MYDASGAITPTIPPWTQGQSRHFQTFLELFHRKKKKLRKKYPVYLTDKEIQQFFFFSTKNVDQIDQGIKLKSHFKCRLDTFRLPFC